MKKINIHQVDAFTTKVFGGNPAGVVTEADHLTDDEMLKIAREMNLSETAFVLRPSSSQADIKLRFYTPSTEVQFCGHATVGTLFELARLGMFELGKKGKNDIRVETNIGILPMAVINNDGPTITFTAPEVDLELYHLQGSELAQALAVASNLISTDAQIFRDKNLNYLYIPTTSLHALQNQSFDFTHIREKFDAENIIVFCFYSRETMEKQSILHARGLAPNVGIDEDPFTGSMQAGLIHAAKKNGYIKDSAEKIVTEQGYEIGRPGMATVIHTVADNSVLVTTSAAHVFSAEMEF